jgi:hypothetical protein
MHLTTQLSRLLEEIIASVLTGVSPSVTEFKVFTLIVMSMTILQRTAGRLRPYSKNSGDFHTNDLIKTFPAL